MMTRVINVAIPDTNQQARLAVVDKYRTLCRYAVDNIVPAQAFLPVCTGILISVTGADQSG